MSLSRFLPAVILAIAALSSASSPARAELALASGAAWPGAGHVARPVGSLAWRQDLAGAWRAEARGGRASSALSVRHEFAGRFAHRLRPAVAAGVVGAQDRSPMPRVTGFHAETAVAFALPEGAALELSARWVMRGDHGPRGPDRFADRFVEVTLGLVFAPR
ncbi:MAG: hypothetical protein ABL977_16840 [Candidatus Eisenbacteria bacterium]